MIVIDRFEGDLAIVEYNGTIFTLPRTLIPKDASEGDVLKATIEIDPAYTANRRKRIMSLEDRLFKK